MIKTFAGTSGLRSISQRFLLHQQFSTFSTLRQEAQVTYLPGLSIRTYSLATRDPTTPLTLYMACYKMPHFLFQRTPFLFHVHSLYIFFFHSLEEKESASREKWTAFLSHSTTICIYGNPTQRPFVSVIDI